MGLEPPTQKVIKVLKHVLAIHDEMEERNDGMYELCETLTQAQTNEIMEQLKAVTMVPVHPFNVRLCFGGCQTGTSACWL